MRRQTLTILSAALVLLSLPAGAVDRPDKIRTPGMSRTHDVAAICSREPRGLRSEAKRRLVARAYQRFRDWRYVVDHLIPLSSGGADEPSNMWAQPRQESRLKDKCEAAARAEICSGRAEPAEIQAGFATDFVALCAALGRPVE